MDETERDLDLVLITGAGASAPFGLNRTQLPTMRQWSDALVKKLGTSHPSYLAATGLEFGLDGPTFEQRLGTFLRAIPALGAIKDVVKASVDFQPPSEPWQQISEQAIEHWHYWLFALGWGVGSRAA